MGYTGVAQDRGRLNSRCRRWIASRKNYVVPVKVLSRVFRGKFLDYLGQAHRDGKLELTASLEQLRDPDCFGALINKARRKPVLAVLRNRVYPVKSAPEP